MVGQRKRNYAAEYQRRKDREAERAAREGRKPSLARARGHKSPEAERQRAKLRRLAKKTETPWEDVKEALDHSWEDSDLIELLEEKEEAIYEYDHGRPQAGQRLWQGRNDALADSFFYYHGKWSGD